MTLLYSPEIKQPSKKDFIAMGLFYVAIWAVASSAIILLMRGAA